MTETNCSGRSLVLVSVTLYSSQNASRFHEPGPPSVITPVRSASSGAGGKWTSSVRAGGVFLAANLYFEDTQPVCANSTAPASAMAIGAARGDRNRRLRPG